MVKRTRAASVASTSQADSILSTSSNGDNEYIAEVDNARPATRRRTNNTRSKLASTTSSGSVSADIASPSPSASNAEDPKSARKQQRKERNRISAQHSRDRKKFESQELRGRLEEAETRVSALAADNERLLEENSRFKLELEKSSSLQGELTSLKERFEMLERLLLAGSQSSLSSSAASTAASLATPATLPHPSQSPISAPVQADSRIGSETHALAVPFNDELGQLQRNDGIETGQGQSAGYEQIQQQQHAGEYNEQSSTIIDYSSLDDLLYNNSNSGSTISSSAPFSLAAEPQDSLYTTFEDLLSNTSGSMSTNESFIPSGQATLPFAASTEATGLATSSTATSSGSAGQSQDYHDDDDRFYVKQQEELSTLLLSTPINKNNDSIDYLGSYLNQAAQPYEDLSKSTNPFFFGIPLDTLISSNTFSSSLVV